jgi:hypothetical protein
VFISTRAVSRLFFVAVLTLLASSASSYAQTTGQLLISSGFNPIAATTPELTARLKSLPPNQFVLRNKSGRTYYVYADPSGCNCAFVGSPAAMDKYRASFVTLPADTLSSGSYTNPEQNMINSMEQDDAGADVFAPQY